jgi:nonsense-mediated mRNA decay protein 3
MSDTDARGFCPECGDPVAPEAAAQRPDRPGSTGLCDACYFERFDLVDAPERIEVQVCSACGAVHRGNRWVDVGARDYTDVAIDEVTEALSVHVDAREVRWGVDPEQVDENTVRMHCEFDGIVRSTPVEAEVVVPVKISRGTCTRCGRIAGDYYASTIQVRADGRDPAPEETDRAREIAAGVVEEMEATGDREAFVTDVQERPGGLDIRVSTTAIGKRIANKLVEEFGGTVSDSETLVTEDEEGNEVYRVTFAVRLPAFRPGDVIDPGDGDGPVLVRSVRGRCKGVRLATGDRFEAAFEDLDARRLGDRGDAVETTLVAVEDDRAVQVLDPETYRAETVPRPDYLDPEAETVPVVKTRAGVHVVPDA